VTPSGVGIVLSQTVLKAHVWLYRRSRGRLGGVTFEVNGETCSVTAVEARGKDYERLWQRFTAAYPRFAEYRRKTTRHLPLFRLEPSAGQDA
jgi:F420H(2)-dependent quinone reductase